MGCKQKAEDLTVDQIVRRVFASAVYQFVDLCACAAHMFWGGAPDPESDVISLIRCLLTSRMPSTLKPCRNYRLVVDALAEGIPRHGRRTPVVALTSLEECRMAILRPIFVLALICSWCV